MIFIYWEEVGLDKQLCKKCEKLFEKEYSRFREDVKKEHERLDIVIRKCDNCGKIRPKKSKKYEEEIYSWCSKHGKCDSCVMSGKNLCSLKCLKVVENRTQTILISKFNR